MVLTELDSARVISRVELIRNIPSQRPELPSLLYTGMQECNSVQQWFPLGKVGNFQLVLGDTCECSLQTGLDSLWGIKGELDGALEDSDGELGMSLTGYPHAHLFVGVLSRNHVVQHLVHVVQTQVTVLEQHPATCKAKKVEILEMG